MLKTEKIICTELYNNQKRYVGMNNSDVPMRSSGRRGRPLEQSLQGSTARKHAPDYWLLLFMVGLLAVGLIVVYSIGPALALGSKVGGNTFVLRQMIAIAIGLVLFALASKVPLRMWRQLCTPLLIAAGVATLIALALPVIAEYPAHRWIRIGGMSFQSVELLKFALILWLGGFLVDRAEQGELNHPTQMWRKLLIVLVGAGIVVAGLQSDLGSAAVIMAIMLGMLFVAGVSMQRVLIAIIVVVIGGLLFINTSDYRRHRIETFLNPSIDCSSSESGYQACQALIAVGSGGMVGLGLGNSVQAYGYLPMAENDSIFAIYAEKFGFIGTTVLLGLFLALFSRIKRVADGAPDNYSRLVVTGIFVWFSTQALINIAAMIGLLPLKGITLPLISYGGSSVLMVLVALGVVFQVSRYTSFKTRERRGNV